MSTYTVPTQGSLQALNHDFGLVTLSREAPVGTSRLAILPGYGQQSYEVQTAGYPGDKPAGTMWSTSCDLRTDFQGNAISVSEDWRRRPLSCWQGS